MANEQVIRSAAVESVLNEVKQRPYSLRSLQEKLRQEGYTYEADKIEYLLKKFPCRVDGVGMVHLEDDDEPVATIESVSIPKDKLEQWNKVVVSKGRYNVDGTVAVEYLYRHIIRELLHGDNYQSIIVLGEKSDLAAFRKRMIADGVTDEAGSNREFMFGEERQWPDGDPCMMGLRSLDHVEELQGWMRNAKQRGYHRVAAIVVLNPYDGVDDGRPNDSDLKYIDKMLKVPNGTTPIEVPIFVVQPDAGDYSCFEKVDNTTPSGVTRTLEVTFGHEMKPEVIEFLVPEFIPLHQATAFSGEMDTRKSTLALDIAAAGSLWRPWFMGTENHVKPFLTLVAADEDTYTTTVLPRYLAAGGDPRCLGCLGLNIACRKQADDGMQEWGTPLSFDEHLNLLGNKITNLNSTREWKVGLLINDPIISFFGNKNYNNPQDARDIMRGLKKLCEELKITIINICHFNKTQGLTAKQKTAGSKALIEAHRMAWAFDLMEDDKSTTLIAPIKHNLLKDARSYKITTDGKEIEWECGDDFYQKTEVGVVRFLGYSNMTADERIEEKEDKGRGNRKEIEKAILDALLEGPKPAGVVTNELRDMGGIATIRRAAQSLEEKRKIVREGNNRRNITWRLATEAEQPRFDEVKQ